MTAEAADTATKSEAEYRKILVQTDLLDLLREASIGMKVSVKICLQLFMMEVANLANTRPELFGFHYANARKRLDGRGEFAEHDAVYKIDLARLHRTDKTKSGFVGVYAASKGFTAHAKTSVADSVQISLGTFPTAAQAAEARRVHYFKHGIPYGVLGDKLESFRGTPNDMYPEELKRRISIFELAQAGTPAEGISDEERVWETRNPIEYDRQQALKAAAEEAARQAEIERPAREAVKQKMREAQLKSRALWTVQNRTAVPRPEPSTSLRNPAEATQQKVRQMADEKTAQQVEADRAAHERMLVEQGKARWPWAAQSTPPATPTNECESEPSDSDEPEHPSRNA